MAAPIAGIATASVVAGGVFLHEPPTPAPAAARLAASDLPDDVRLPLVSRSESRTQQQEATTQRAAYRRQLAEQRRERRERALQKVVTAAQRDADKRWTTAALNLWTGAAADARQVGGIAEGKQVLLTGRSAQGRAEVVIGDVVRWVTAEYLSTDKPLSAAAGLSGQPCPDGSVENGLTANAVMVYRSVCHAFPQITSYGGWDGHGEHSSGRALDIMTSDVALGNAIAEFLQSHASELHLYDILWRQRIWTPVRAAEGWRVFASRGSATANHYDHVHVSTY